MPLLCRRLDRAGDRLGFHRPHPGPRLGDTPAVATDRVGWVCDLVDSGDQGLPGTDVQAAGDRRHGGTASRGVGSPTLQLVARDAIGSEREAMPVPINLFSFGTSIG